MKEALENHNFAEYFSHYIDLVEDIDIEEALEKNQSELKELFDFLVEDQGNYKYAEDKWSIKDLLVHIIDTERIFCYRALSFARNEKADLAGFEHDEYVKSAEADNRTLCDISKDFEATRKATLQLFKSFTPDMLSKEGTASGNRLTVSAIGYIIVGHSIHHLKVLEEKYLNE